MNRTLLAVSSAMLLAGCAIDGAQESCPGHSGIYTVRISYGEGGITVDQPRIRVRSQSILAILLRPDVDFRDALVTTEGTSVTPVTPTPPDKSWLDEQGRWSDEQRLIACVPQTPEDTRYTYKYSVEVEGLGILDPRVDVTW